MKHIRKIIGLLLLLIFTALIIWLVYYFYWTEKKPNLYSTAKPETRTIKHIIKATGYLEVKDMMKIGSLVSGILDKMLVEENDIVKKGQLLALVDDGREDTLVKQAQAALDGATARYNYLKEFYQRQKKLFEAKQISLDAFQKTTSDYELSKAEVELTKGRYEEAALQFNNKKITAPDNGIVIAKIASEGETVTLSSPPTLIYTIAKDITKMEAKLEVDESVIGNLKIGAKAILTFDTYPNKKFEGTITQISNAPKNVGGAVSYLATINLDNTERLFRPGMTVNSEILIAGRKNAIAIQTNILKLKRAVIQDIAKTIKMGFEPLSEEQREELEKRETLKTIWLIKNNSFVEQPITVGVTDDAYYEVVSGLEGDEEVVIDTVEPDYMKEFFEQFFGKGMTE